MRARLPTGIIRFLLIFAAVIVLHWPALTLPHHWDALNRVHNAHTIAAHGFSPFLPKGMTFLDAQGRPPLLLQLLALTTLVAPFDLIAAHALWLLLAALALYLTDRIGARAWSPAVGLTAALWLALNPLFFAQNEIIVMETPVTALTLLAGWCLLAQRPVAYLLAGTLLVLSKEAAQLALPGFVLFAWAAAPPNRRWRDALVAAIPFVGFLLWVCACKLRYGWFLDPYMASFVRPDEGGALWRGIGLSGVYFTTLLVQLTFWDGNWAVTLLALGAVALNGPPPSRRTLSFAAIAAAATYATYPALLAAAQHWVSTDAFVTTGALLRDTYQQLVPLRIVASLVIGLLILAWPALLRLPLRDPRGCLCLGIVAGYVGFFTLIKFRMIRYLLPTYPFLLLLGAAALHATRLNVRRYAWSAALAATAIFVAQFSGARTGPGNILETNLEFRDMVAVRHAAAAYLEGLPASTRVLAAWPETMELRYPYEGYVTRPLTISEDPRGRADLVYVSPQSRDPDLSAAFRRTHPTAALVLLFRAQRNGKLVEIYRIAQPGE